MKSANLILLCTTGIALLLNGCVAKTPEAKNEEKVNSQIIAKYLDEKGERVETSSDKLDSILTGKSNYEKERDKLLAKIVKTPPIPMRVPDTVLRVLLLPYVDDTGTLTAQNYKFVTVNDGKWILGEYLIKEGSTVNMLTPLSEKIIAEQKEDKELKTTENKTDNEIGKIK